MRELQIIVKSAYDGDPLNTGVRAPMRLSGGSNDPVQLETDPERQSIAWKAKGDDGIWIGQWILLTEASREEILRGIELVVANAFESIDAAERNGKA